MGLELLAPTPEDWARIVHEHVSSTKEQARRAEASKRVKLYRDDFAQLIAYRFSTIFKSAVYKRIEPLIPLLGGTSFLKRVSNETGRPLYARAPMRRVVVKSEPEAVKTAQEAYAALCKEMQLNACMDTAARLITACGAVFLCVRYVASLERQHLDVVTPDMLSVIPHPEAKTVPLAVAYVTKWLNDQPFEHVVWDDKRYFSVANGAVLGEVTPHDYGVIPWVDIHLPGRTNEYWQPTINADLVSQDEQSKLFDLVGVKKVKTQSHLQVSYIGDSEAFVKGQVLDEESVLHAESGSINVLNFESDPSKVLDAKLAAESAVAANHGLSRDRLNQTSANPSDDGLQERVAELAGVFVPAEGRLFDVVKVLSREHPEWKGTIPDDAQVLVDLGQLHHRVDRTTQLAIRREETSRGLRSRVDDVLDDNPEYAGDREQAMAHLREKSREEAIVVEQQRALNAPADADAENMGQSAADNGAMGPAVRDGDMTRDEAAQAAEGGDSAYRALIAKVMDAA
jgi:hypothetical protein